MKKTLQTLGTAILFLLSSQAFAGPLSERSSFHITFACQSENGLRFNFVMDKAGDDAPIKATGSIIRGSVIVSDKGAILDRVTINHKLGWNEPGFFKASLNYTEMAGVGILKGNIGFDNKICSTGLCSNYSFDYVGCRSI